MLWPTLSQFNHIGPMADTQSGPVKVQRLSRVVLKNVLVVIAGEKWADCPGRLDQPIRAEEVPILAVLALLALTLALTLALLPVLALILAPILAVPVVPVVPMVVQRHVQVLKLRLEAVHSPDPSDLRLLLLVVLAGLALHGQRRAVALALKLLGPAAGHRRRGAQNRAQARGRRLRQRRRRVPRAPGRGARGGAGGGASGGGGPGLGLELHRGLTHVLLHSRLDRLHC
mmetsp:Transcript_49976/g.119269  ORF Transcript_49976/g.119269 Transcript_49976/m.119269 type:complete len:229 (+) Transcript_49976:132-818(+)